MIQATYGPYSPVREAGQTFFVSGQIGIDPATKQTGKTVEAQTRQVMENLKAVLADAGLEIQHVVKTTVYLKNMGDFAAMNEIYLQYFEAPRPARACVAVAELPRVADVPLLVEVEAVAYLDQSDA